MHYEIVLDSNAQLERITQQQQQTEARPGWPLNEKQVEATPKRVYITNSDAFEMEI